VIARSAIAAPSSHRSTARLDEASLEEVLAGRSRRRGTQAVHYALEAGLDLGDGPQEPPDSIRASLAVMEAMVTRNFGF
jgi:hypothetical protein